MPRRKRRVLSTITNEERNDEEGEVFFTYVKSNMFNFSEEIPLVHFILPDIKLDKQWKQQYR